MRAIAAEDTLTCYFVNNGDPVSDLSIEAELGIVGDINPKDKIGNRDAGAIKFTCCKADKDFSFRLHFSGPEKRLYTEFSFLSAHKKFVPLNRTALS